MEPRTSHSDHHTLWQMTCQHLKKLISPDAFQRWFAPITPVACESDRLILGIENSISQYWIEENYFSELCECFELAGGRGMKIAFEAAATQDSRIISAAHPSNGTTTANSTATAAAPAASRSRSSSRPPANDLIPRYQFDTFVVGMNNQFAHAAARAVAESPARTYNPLFIHGSVGLGKTHLMHAVGHHILDKRPSAKIVYVTSEQFTNEFVTAIQHGELIKFRRRFRQADALFIDDVQFFAGKDRSQEEFFHTFNALFDGNKQIVLTSDSPPSEVHNLEQRLVSRFEWGLTAELQPPDIETRLAILRSKSEKMNVRLGDSVLLFIAENIKANIRRLEGALNRVAAWATLNERRITQAQVEDLLKDFIQQERTQAVSIDLIQRRVAESFDIRMSDMTSKRRPNNIAIPRMVAMYLSRQKTGKSLQDIGDAFGGRDHGTVLHAVKKVESLMQKELHFRQQVELVSKKLESPNA